MFLQRVKKSLESSCKWILHRSSKVKMVARRRALYTLATLNRRLRTDVVVVGITGSAGKTTTKDLCVVLLGEDGRVHGSKRSMNEHDAVVETIRGVEAKHCVCVVELSASGPGYLDFPLALAKPDVAVLTVIARDHFSAFKSIDAIAQEKAKLVAALPANGTAVLNMDDPQIRRIGETCERRVIWVGETEGATLRLREARSCWPDPLTLVVEHLGVTYAVPTSLHGTHLSLAVLCALGVALALEIPLSIAIPRLMRVELTEGRMQIVPSNNGVDFVRDDWKAPLWSLDAPFEFMRQAQAKRKVLIIGTLSDYSVSASKLYPKIAKQALEIGALVVFVGPHAMRALKASPDQGVAVQKLFAFPSLREASAWLRAALEPGDLVLLKGSHKTDHLVRLVLDREKPIGCWKEKCGLDTFCNRCDQLYVGRPLEDLGLTEKSSIDRKPSYTSLIASEDLLGQKALVVVGLGNPAVAYSNTPHNIGYRVLDQLSECVGCLWEEVTEGQVCHLGSNESRAILLKPRVSMNHSGASVLRFLERIGGGKLIVVHDDMDLLIGTIRHKRDGGDAGHRGVRSIISKLGTGKFERIRVGVRRSGDDKQALDLVLEQFSVDENIVVSEVVARAAEMISEKFLSERSTRVMGELGSRED